MKALAAVLGGLALALSACGSGNHAASSGFPSPAFRALPHPLRVFIRTTLAHPADGPTRELDVYGPGTHASLEQAAMGDVVNDPEKAKDFYLVVQHGRYVCSACSSVGPTGAGVTPTPPHGTIEKSVWSAGSQESDWGISEGLPAAMVRLHPIAVIKLS